MIGKHDKASESEPNTDIGGSISDFDSFWLVFACEFVGPGQPSMGDTYFSHAMICNGMQWHVLRLGYVWSNNVFFIIFHILSDYHFV